MYYVFLPLVVMAMWQAYGHAMAKPPMPVGNGGFMGPYDRNDYGFVGSPHWTHKSSFASTFFFSLSHMIYQFFFSPFEARTGRINPPLPVSIDSSLSYQVSIRPEYTNLCCHCCSKNECLKKRLLVKKKLQILNARTAACWIWIAGRFATIS